MDFDLALDQILLVYCQVEIEWTEWPSKWHPGLDTLHAGMCIMFKSSIVMTHDQSNSKQLNGVLD